MSYVRWYSTWVNLPSHATAANAGFLQHVEDTFVSMDTRVTTLEAGGGLAGVSTVTAGDSTILVAGTTANPTIKVNAIPESDVTNLVTDLTNKASLVSGKVPTSQLASGTANSTTFLRGDQTWQVPSGGGGGAVSSVAGRTGAVVLTSADVGLNNISNTAQIPASILNNQGALVSSNTSGVLGKIDASANFGGEVLTYDGLPTLGIKWAFPAYGTVQDEGVDLTPRAKLNFRGAGVIATDGGGFTTNVDISGASSVGAPFSPLAYNTSGFTDFVQIPTNIGGSGARGGSFSITMTKDTRLRLLDDGLSEVCNTVNLLIIQDSTGGRLAKFAPNTIHWVPNTASTFDTIDTNWTYEATQQPGPIVDSTPGSRTYIRLTYIGTMGGWLGEVVAYIKPLYTTPPTTWTNTINATGNPHTLYLSGGIMRFVDQSSVTHWLDALTNPTWVSDTHRQRMANHGGSIWLCRAEPSDAPPIAYSRGGSTGSGLTVPTATCYADAGFGPGYPPGYDAGAVQGGVLHEYSHMEDASYFTVAQPDPTYGSIQISSHTPIQNNFNACLALGATPVGADPNSVTEWYAEMRRYQRLVDNTSMLRCVGTGTSGTTGFVTPQNRVDAFKTYINSLNGGVGLL